MLYVTRRETFNSAHRLFNLDWTDDKNLEVYGPCSNKNWHGHNYNLFVTVKGEMNPDTGFVVNMKLLSRIIHENVIVHVDHKNLNLDVDFLKGVIPTSENMCVAIWKMLEAPINILGIQLHSVKIQETEKNYAEYLG
ncbi:MAG: 6-pyruvoyl tetrahydrobiopterin synthase [Bacteroidetes bacterium GWF2_38_335]|nr:MAG: 6-pyruvoyl tetrahydrobiopterin synthase [Bacteroidetes bacterium GWF2_38_335]OFY78637.1 MAG: 6-pyruvoyl tetrahydrobiopterin synthase [Bacteroidetes bacterium RIFOXYA12_FULL_38_20]HBS88367.1 6-pyruvoyl tetrahydrobiopterin synthase [Bacteroidales bacterium]